MFGLSYYMQKILAAISDEFLGGRMAAGANLLGEMYADDLLEGEMEKPFPHDWSVAECKLQSSKQKPFATLGLWNLQVPLSSFLKHNSFPKREPERQNWAS